MPEGSRDNGRSHAEQFWDDCFTRVNPDYKKTRDFSGIITRLKQNKVKHVLDLGSGFGYCSIALAKAGFHVAAVDISSEAIRKLRIEASENGLGITARVCAAQDVDFKSQKFDAVICNSVLDHMTLQDAKTTLRNVKNILKNSGVAFLSFDGLEEDDEKEFETLRDGTRRYVRGKHKGMLWRFFPNDEIRSLLKDFEILEFTEKVPKSGKREIWIRASC